MTATQYVLMDRDGVINHDSDDYIKSPEEWRPIEGSLEAIALLNRFHYKIVVITNQASLARGLFDKNTLEKIHQKMRSMAAEKGGKIEAVYYCPHSPENNCDCRKPKPGLLRSFAADNQIELKNLYFIGDSLRDIQAAQAAGACRYSKTSMRRQNTSLRGHRLRPVPNGFDIPGCRSEKFRLNSRLKKTGLGQPFEML
jgi:D-glycero-D-manno-heptose 1,7-bisphosphate phosphatase